MKNLLVVDDDEQVLRLIELCLRPAGYQITKAKNGNEALVKALANPPDVIIADIVMPEKDGPEFVGELWERLEKRDIPIIFLTGLISKSEQEKQNQITTNQHFLAKPFEPAQLKQLVAQACA